LITIQLTKLETALDQVRKTYPKLKPADAALVTSALTIAGRHAQAIYDEVHYTWPEQYEDLTKAMVAHLEQVNEGIETVKKTVKNAPEEEPVFVSIGLAPNLTAAESFLGERNDLKTLMSDILQSGVEYNYAGTDLGWQWALDRANWNTISGGELSRRIKIKATFTEGAVGTESGTTTKKRPSRAKAAVVVEPEPAPEQEAVEESGE